jgi:poly-gamma-glutamate capsule biosynthesis protein CapA/YwtB (metallophosphatase superfamily)
VVTLHYGAESKRHPDPLERQLMRSLAAAGADLFIGTHPHVLRGIELIDNMVVFWSLGNFLFDSPRPDWCESGIVHVDFVKDATGTSMKNIRLIPITLTGEPRRLPHPAAANRAQKIISDIRKHSRRFRNPPDTIEFRKKSIEVHLP